MSTVTDFMRRKPAVAITLYGVVLAGFIAFIAINNSETGETAPIPTFTPGEQIDPGVDEGSTTSTPTPTPSPSEEHGGEEHIHHDIETDLSAEEQQTAEKIILGGIENYFAVGSKETTDERTARLSAYFPAGSPYLDPDSDEGLVLEGSDSEEVIVEQSGTVQWTNPQKGESNTYVTIAALNIQAMFTADGESEIFQGYMVLQVTAEKVDGEWRITEMIEVDS